MPQDDDEAIRLVRDYVLDPENETPGQARRQPRRAQRLRPLPGPYVRVPLQWLLKPHFASPFTAEAVLFLLLLYRSHWGQRGVKVTDAVGAEIGISARTRRKALRQLQQKGWIRVERHRGHEAPTAWPITLTG